MLSTAVYVLKHGHTSSRFLEELIRLETFMESKSTEGRHYWEHHQLYNACLNVVLSLKVAQDPCNH